MAIFGENGETGGIGDKNGDFSGFFWWGGPDEEEAALKLQSENEIAWGQEKKS